MLDGKPIHITSDCQGRAWFCCGTCNERCRHLYFYSDQLVCRTCAGLRYASESGYRSTPTARQISVMRRQAGVNEVPFSDISRHVRGQRRFHRRVRAIWAAEEALIRQLREMNDAAECARRSTAPAKRKRTG